MLRQLKNRLTGKHRADKKEYPAWQEEIVKEVKEYTMTSAENILALIRSVEYCLQNKIEGAIVECGVWKGGSMMTVAKTLLHLQQANRPLYLYDTFCHFSTPGTADISFDDKTGSEILQSLAAEGEDWKAPSLEEVKHNLAGTGYPSDLFHFIKGEVEQTIPGILPEKIALLRLDTDWYASTRHELQWLYPKLVKGGVLIIDDYGYWKGCRKAVDEYFSEQQIPGRLIEIDFSARLHYKT